MSNTIVAKPIEAPKTSAPVKKALPPSPAPMKPLLVPLAPFGACVVLGKTSTPAPDIDECDSKKTTEVTLKGPLFSGDPKPSQVGQGAVGDCYFCSAVAAIAQQNPEAIKKMIKDNGDGTYTVTFQVPLPFGKGSVPVQITVDDKVWGSTKDKSPVYGNDPNGGTKWFPILEKAYVKFRSSNSYKEINGGWAANGFGAVLGVKTTKTPLLASSTFQKMQGMLIGAKIEAAWADKKPIAINTGSDTSTKGMVADHSYHIIDVKKDADGNVMVRIRNPWSFREPSDNKGQPLDGTDDGCFWVKAEDLGKDFSSIEIPD